MRIDPGFRIPSLAQQNSFIDDVLHRARSVPGIVAAGISDVLPLDGDRSWQVGAQGQVYDKDHHPEAFIRVVSDGYFEALGIALKSGRALTESDRASSEPVVMVNETLARTLWPGQNAVGQMVTQDGGRKSSAWLPMFTTEDRRDWVVLKCICRCVKRAITRL